MKNRQLLIIGFFCLINMTVPCFAKEWRDIFPLKTTRAEVIKMLGSPQENWTVLGENFHVENDIVAISWTRPDCYDENIRLPKQMVNSDSLVYQISFIPKEPLPPEIIKKEEPKEWNDSNTEPIKGFKIVPYSHNCLMGGGGSFACSLSGDGFGYSRENAGVTSLYYYPTKKESDAWKENLKSCSVEQK